MRKVLLSWCVFLIGCAVYAVPAFASPSLCLDDFEGVLEAGQTVDAGAGSGSTVAVSAEKGTVPSGGQALKIVYDAVAGGYIWVARGYGLDVRVRCMWMH